VATTVWSTEAMKSAIATIPNTSRRRGSGSSDTNGAAGLAAGRGSGAWLGEIRGVELTVNRESTIDSDRLPDSDP
jgi:hypothetical protein